MPLMVQRLLVALAAGAALALLDIYLTSGSLQDAWDVGSPAFWTVFISRLSIGFFVAIAGVITIHPLFKFRMYLLRGAVIGIWVSLPLATAVFVDPLATWFAFGIVIAAGAIYGILIDFVATTVAGHGTKLLAPEND